MMLNASNLQKQRDGKKKCVGGRPQKSSGSVRQNAKKKPNGLVSRKEYESRKPGSVTGVPKSSRSVNGPSLKNTEEGT